MVTFYEVLALSNLAVIDLIFVEFIMSMIFTIDSHGNIKITIQKLFGLSPSKNTRTYVYTFIIIGIIYFVISNFFQNYIVSFFINYLGLNLITSFFMFLSFTIFWITKVQIGRSWKFPDSKISFIMFLVLLLVLIIGLVIKYSYK